MKKCIMGPMTIGIYGLGRFGSFFASALAKGGERVIAWSRHEHELPAGVGKASEDEVLGADYLIFCVAISALEEVLMRVKDRIGRDTVVCDTCSVKMKPAEWMESILGEGFYRIATHPMFGPDSGRNGLEGLPLVMCPIDGKTEKYERLKRCFEKLGCKVLEMTPEQHDREAAYSQGITHFVGRVLSDMDLEDTDIATRGYLSLMEIKDQTCNDPWQLFLDLQHYNPYTKDMRNELREALLRMLEKIEPETKER